MRRIICISILSSFKLIVSISILFFAVSVVAPAGEIVEEFDSPNLNKEIWEIQAVGGASFEIKDGELIMKSPAIEDGILLRYIPEITGQDITFEFSLDLSQGDPSAQIWFADEPLVPDINTTVNERWILVQTVLNTGVTYVKSAGDQKVIQDKPAETTEPNIHKIVLQNDKATFFVNDEEMGETDRPDGLSYFHIGPDMYTSHYNNRIGILDYVKISGPDVHTRFHAHEGRTGTTVAGIMAFRPASVHGCGSGKPYNLKANSGIINPILGSNQADKKQSITMSA